MMSGETPIELLSDFGTTFFLTSFQHFSVMIQHLVPRRPTFVQCAVLDKLSVKTQKTIA